MSDAKFYMDYSRYQEGVGYESWEQSVERVMAMHRTFYKDRMSADLAEIMNRVEGAYKDKKVLGAQRALQFGGEQLLRKHAKMYNCVSSYADRPEFFGEFFWLSLCGCGAGFSVQRQHVAKLPSIMPRRKSVKRHVVADSIEGWAEAFDVLFSSFFVGGGKHPEFESHPVYFDLHKVRAKGAYISGGFKAPGPEPLRKALDQVEALLSNLIENKQRRLKPIEVYDCCMYMADAVISGGVRRSATICMFSKDDEEMVKAKTGTWFVDNPQRSRSNNSVMLKRDEVTFEEFRDIMESVRHSGEPGFIFTDSLEFSYNPCVTGDTLILTDEGDVRIDETVGKKVKVWNGREFSEVEPYSTGVQPIYEVFVTFEEQDGKWSSASVRCTPNHKFVLKGGERVEAKELKPGMALEQFTRPCTKNAMSDAEHSEEFVSDYKCFVDKVFDLEMSLETFCFTEPLNNTGTFNGIVTGQCVEVGMLPVTPEGATGWQACNLTEINGGLCFSAEAFHEACFVASALGTLQAGYTNFEFLSPASREIIEREALIGVGITGWMNNPHILFDEAVLRKGAQIVKQTNKVVAELIGINQAARCCVSKPAGNSSVILQTASGIHGEHSGRYLRNVQMNETSEILHAIEKLFPSMVENSVWSNNGTDKVVSFPIIPKQGSIYKKDLLGVKQLEYVKKAQQVWVEEGTNVELCTHPQLRHNVSNTISVDDWEAVTKYLYENRQWFCGVSLMAQSGDKAFAQAPFTEVLDEKQIIDKYGAPAIFAAGLVTRGLDAFGCLWAATSCANGDGEQLVESHETVAKRDWIRMFRKFANNHFKGDHQLTSDCLKDVYNLHKWVKIVNALDPKVDLRDHLNAKQYVDVNTLSGQGCAGGVCELGF